MWTTKERIFGFLVLVLCLGILFSPAKGYCVTLTGRIVKNDGATDLEDALIFIYDFELAKSQGLQGTGASVGIVVDVSGSNLYDPKKKQIGIALDEKLFPLDKEYLLLFSTLKMQETENYPSFFYGARYYQPENYSKPAAYINSARWWDVEKLPRVVFTSGTFDLGTVIAPRAHRLRGKIKDENGNDLPDVGVELYYDSNGVPTQIPFPFTRFVRTAPLADSDGFNFSIFGVLSINAGKKVKYYVKLIPNNQGYLDTFIMDETDKPKLIQFSDPANNYDIPGEYRLTKKGAKIWGYIRDKEDIPVTKSMISIQGLSDNEDEPYPVFYVHDPNYNRFSDLTDAEKYLNRVEPYYYYFNPDGSYEINGLPYEDHNYYLSAIELPGDAAKIYATPVWYDGNDGAFDINKAKKIILPGPGGSVQVDFSLNDGACISGNIGLDKVPSADAQAVLEDLVADPNIFDENKVSLVIEAFQVNSDGTLSQIPLGWTENKGIGPYSICGLPPVDYICRSYSLSGLYPPEFYEDQATYFTGTIISPDSENPATGINIGLPLGGMVEGRVTDSNGQPIEDASVLVNQVNLGNPLVGYFFINSEGAFLAQYSRKTDSNGRFYFWGLPAGLYTIFVNGVLKDEDTGYLPQFYTSEIDTSPTMIANQTSPMPIKDNDPNFMTLSDFKLTESGTESGGIISGNISLSLSDPNLVTLSSTACFLRLFNADTGIEISNPLYRFDDPNGDLLPYQIMVPEDGDYILSVQDTGLEVLPHYYNDSVGGATVNREEASPLTISHTSLKNKNIVLSKESGSVSGEVLHSSTGIAGMIVYASQQIMEGPDQGTWRSVRQAETNSNGQFTLKGLYKGTYIFSVTDPSSKYAARYFNTTPGQDPYIPDNADPWNYDPDDPTPFNITFDVQEGGKISGSVGSQFSGTMVYAYRIKDGNPVAGFSDTADPNYRITGLIPGEYILGFKDPNLNYIPEYYSQNGFTTDLDLDNPSCITVEINMTTWVPEMNFTQRGAKVEGQITQGTETDPEPMLNTYIFLYRLSEKRELWATTPAQFTATDSDGNYFLKGLLEGNYKIIAFGPQYRPISRYITITESDLMSVDPVPVDLTFPVNWPETNDKHDKALTLEQGLSLIAYPTRIPPYVTGYTALSFLKDIVMVNGRGALTLKTFSPYDQKWKSASFGNTELEGVQVTDVHGSNYSISNGQGFLLYSEEGPTINFRYFPGQTSLWLKKGINLVGNVAFDTAMADIDEMDFTPDADFTTRKMLTKMGEDASVSIQTFEAREGKWQATYWMWGKSAGKDTKVKDELGYIVTMKEDLNNWYPANNN